MKKMTGILITLSIFSIGILNSCTSTNVIQDENISSITIDVYDVNERNLLEAGFIYAVNRWLRRYSPQMITQSDNYVKMRAKYSYFYDLELFVKEGTFEIVVTFADERRRPSDAPKDAAHLSTGLLRVMSDFIANRSRAR